MKSITQLIITMYLKDFFRNWIKKIGILLILSIKFISLHWNACIVYEFFPIFLVVNDYDQKLMVGEIGHHRMITPSWHLILPLIFVEARVCSAPIVYFPFGPRFEHSLLSPHDICNMFLISAKNIFMIVVVKNGKNTLIRNFIEINQNCLTFDFHDVPYMNEVYFFCLIRLSH